MMKNNSVELPEFIAKLKNEELRSKRNFKKVVGIYWFAIVVYLGILFLPDTYIFSLDKIGTIICLLGFVLILVCFIRAKNKFKNLNFSARTIDLLYEVVQHYNSFLSYKFNKIKPLPLILGIVFIEIGLTLKAYDHFSGIEPLLRIIYIQTAWFLLISLSVGVGFLAWYKRYKPLRDNALIMIKEIEEG